MKSTTAHSSQGLVFHRGNARVDVRFLSKSHTLKAFSINEINGQACSATSLKTRLNIARRRFFLLFACFLGQGNQFQCHQFYSNSYVTRDGHLVVILYTSGSVLVHPLPSRRTCQLSAGGISWLWGAFRWPASLKEELNSWPGTAQSQLLLVAVQSGGDVVFCILKCLFSIWPVGHFVCNCVQLPRRFVSDRLPLSTALAVFMSLVQEPLYFFICGHK